MAWIKFPNQMNDLLKLRRALSTAAAIKPTNLKDDGIYGDALLNNGVIKTGKTKRELRLLPTSRQPHRTTARGLREMFRLLGCMVESNGRVSLTGDGRAIANATGAVLAPRERATWLKLVSQLRFPHPQYPAISPGVTSVRPAHVLLAMLVTGPLPSQGLAMAFTASNEGSREIAACRRRAARWTSRRARSLARQVGTTESELKNNAKVFPGILEQLGLIRREAGTARIEPLGLRFVGSSGIPAGGTPPRKKGITRPKRREIRSTSSAPWTPSAPDSSDLLEKARLRLLRLERANQDHQAALSIMASWLRRRGFKTFEADYDILATKKSLWILLEIKSIAAAAVRSQLMRAIGQLAYYAALSVRKPPKGTELVRAVVFDRPFSDQRVQRVLKNEGISLLWIDGKSVEFGSDKTFAKLA